MNMLKYLKASTFEKIAENVVAAIAKPATIAGRARIFGDLAEWFKSRGNTGRAERFFRKSRNIAETGLNQFNKAHSLVGVK
jgi:hypothetical protein